MCQAGFAYLQMLAPTNVTIPVAAPLVHGSRHIYHVPLLTRTHLRCAQPV
jgi:hypothetical protein